MASIGSGAPAHSAVAWQAGESGSERLPLVRHESAARTLDVLLGRQEMKFALLAHVDPVELVNLRGRGRARWSSTLTVVRGSSMRSRRPRRSCRRSTARRTGRCLGSTFRSALLDHDPNVNSLARDALRGCAPGNSARDAALRHGNAAVGGVGPRAPTVEFDAEAWRRARAAAEPT